MSKKKSGNSIYWILGILLVLFFGILIYSTSNSNTSIEYSFNEDVEMNGDNYQNKIGEAVIINNKMIPAKVRIKDLIGCIYDNGTYQYNVEHIGSRDKTQSYDIISGDYYSTYVEVSSKDEITLDLIINQGYPIRDLIKPTEKNLSGEYTLYLFEAENSYIYNLCQELRKEDSYKTITLNY